MSEYLTWRSEMSFGKHKGKTILQAWIADKDYFRWAIENEVNKPEVVFVKEAMSDAEARQLKLI